MAPLSFYPSLDKQVTVAGVTHYPAAIVHGDLVVKGTIHYETPKATTSITKVPLPDSTPSNTHNITVQAKDTYVDASGVGICGVRYISGHTLQS